MLNQLPQINPLDTTAMHFFDLGDIESPDGRAHPVTAMTPVGLVASDPQTPDKPQVNVPVYVPGVGTFQIPGSGAAIDAVTGKHLAARFAIAVLAIGILLVVVFRLTK